ncbi:MAG: phosphate:Na+ symporter [Sphingobacteriales bacterium]|jgi:phosphate:Na+ symporter
MEYTIWDFLLLLGALGIFIYGMKVMSEGLQKLSGEGLKKILGGMTSNRIAGIFTGFLITGLIQSSSATTVMVVSFVNAGLLSLTQSLGVVMGANIGTTITAWLIAILGFKVNIQAGAIIVIGLTFPLMFAKNIKLKYLAEFILGFGILFIGLGFLKDAVPDIKQNPQILEFLSAYTSDGFGSILFFVFIGTLLTVIVQSSSATMAITLVMLAQGWIPFTIAAAIVLGENIGTTITANLAALVGNVNAKRTARFHTIFNLIGVTWLLLIFPWFLNMIDNFQEAILGNGSVFDAVDMNATEKMTGVRQTTTTLGLSLFHTTFNVCNVLLLFFLVPQLEKLVIKITPTKHDLDEQYSLQYLSTGLMATAELSIEEAWKQVQLMGKLVDKMFGNITLLIFEEPKSRDNLIEKIKKREEITDRIEVEVSNYLTEVLRENLSEEASIKVRAALRIVNEFERIGDLAYQMAMNEKKLRSSKFIIPAEAKEELEKLFDLVYKSLKLIHANFNKEIGSIDMKVVYEAENKINNSRDTILKKHFKRLENNEYSARNGIILLNFVNAVEKIGDHIVNVNEALAKKLT